MVRPVAGLAMICASLIIMCLIPAGQSYAEIDPETVVGVWLFDEGEGEIAGDSSENGNGGKIFGAKWVDGKFGKALDFDGTIPKPGIPDLWIKLRVAASGRIT